MLSKARIKLIRSLRWKKYRYQHKLFIAEGTKIVTEIVQSGVPLQQIYATGAWLTTHADVMAHVPCQEVTPDQMKQITMLSTPSPVMAVIKMPKFSPAPLPQDRWSLYLDDIRDPGNLGTIIRIADWFGWDHIYCSPESADVYHPKVIQATMGSFLRVTCREAELNSLLPGVSIPVWGATMDGTSLFDLSPPPAGLLCIGNEAKGLMDSTIAQLTQQVTIPGGGGAESLNAGVATGIFVAQITQNRRQ